MEMVIVTGLSGAGKSWAIDVFEDIGYYCIDNMPPFLIPKFAELSAQSDGVISKIAMVVDIRGGSHFNSFIDVLDELDEIGISYKILYLDADDAELVRRYKETRRKHPLLDECGSVQKAIAKERKILEQARNRADFIIDTTHLSNAQLKENIVGIFMDGGVEGLLINCVSFGFKHGLPIESDLVFDVRCLPNPFYIPELKASTGMDQPVEDYVMQFPQSVELFDKIRDLLDFLIPLYVAEGKSQLTISFGCTGGKHRSVVFAKLMHRHLKDKGYRTIVSHRDALK